MQPDLLINLKQFRKIQQINIGPFYETSLVENCQPKLFISIESTNKKLFDQHELEKLIKEQYPAFCIPVGFSKTNFEGKDFPTVLFDYSTSGSLSSLLLLPGIDLKRDTTTYIILLGIALAIRNLHRQNKSLFDLNPDNIFLDNFLRPHLLYFGDTSISDDERKKEYLKTYRKLPLYLAPEILNNEPLTYKSDAYSFSLIAYQIITGQIPYENLNKKGVNEFIQKVTKGDRPNVRQIPDGVVKGLLVRCWSRRQQERPGFDDIVETLTSYPFYKVFEVDHKEVIEYLSLFGRECNVPLEIFSQNDPDIGQDEIDFLVKETGFDVEAIMAANAIIEGNQFQLDDTDKDFDSMVTMLMYGGHRRRTMEIYLYFANKKHVDFNDDLNRILGIVGFSNVQQPQQPQKDKDENSKGDANTPPDSSIVYF